MVTWRWKLRWYRLLIFLRLRKRHEWTVDVLNTDADEAGRCGISGKNGP